MKSIKEFSIITIITLILLEASLQLYYRVSSGNFLFERVALPIFETDEVRGYKVRGNLSYRHRTNEFDVVYHTNAAGFRTDERRQSISMQKEEGRLRLMFLGPSFAFGWANDWRDTYSHLVGEGLNEQFEGAEVVNAGVPSQSIDAQLCWYEQVGRKYKPDVIIVTLFANEIYTLTAQCDLSTNSYRVSDGYLVPKDLDLVTRIKVSAKNSGLVFYGWYLFQALAVNDQVRSQPTSEKVKTPVERVVSRLRRLHGLLTENRGRQPTVLFMYVPPSFVVRPADRVRYWHQWTPEPAMIVNDVEQIAARLNENGIIFVNPIEALRQADAKARTYYFVDVHLTPLGNRVIADSILRTSARF